MHGGCWCCVSCAEHTSCHDHAVREEVPGAQARGSPSLLGHPERALEMRQSLQGLLEDGGPLAVGSGETDVPKEGTEGANPEAASPQEDGTAGRGGAGVSLAGSRQWAGLGLWGNLPAVLCGAGELGYARTQGTGSAQRALPQSPPEGNGAQGSETQGKLPHASPVSAHRTTLVSLCISRPHVYQSLRSRWLQKTHSVSHSFQRSGLQGGLAGACAPALSPGCGGLTGLR